MKFLITGGARSPSGPRQVLTFALFFLLLFVVIHGFREANTTGVFPAEIAKNLHGETDTPAARSALLVLEDLHVDLLLFSMLYLFIGSLVIQAQMSFPQKKLTLVIVFVVLLVNFASRPATAVLPGFAFVVSVSAVVLHLLLSALIIFLMLDLYKKVKNAGS